MISGDVHQVWLEVITRPERSSLRLQHRLNSLATLHLENQVQNKRFGRMMDKKLTSEELLFVKIKAPAIYHGYEADALA
jgi:hypothetical protein